MTGTMGGNGVTARQEPDLPFVDIPGQSFDREPLAALRETAGDLPLCRSRRGVEVLDYPTVAALITDGRLDSQDATVYGRMGGPQSLVDFADHGLLVAMRGDKHRRLRRVLSAGFRVRQVLERHDSMRDQATLLADQWTDGTCEFVSEFSSPYPMRVLCALLGIPAGDIGMFTAAATELHLLAAVPLDPHFGRIDSALKTLHSYVTDLIAVRHRTHEDDMISSLIAEQHNDGTVTDEELAWSLVNLIFAGQDTTRYQLASAVLELIEHDVWPQLRRDPALIPAAVAEALRIRPVTRFVVRIPREPVIIHGVLVEPGRRIILNLLAASHDPARFTDPDEFRMDRAQPYDLPFGWGAHHCLGAALARTEMEAALSVLTTAFSEVAPSRPPQLTAPGGMLHGPESMQLTFTR
jgi:cytochrome P450